MIRSIIVDDELYAREGLYQLLKLHCPDVEVIAKADSADSAIETIRKYSPDLVFLDYELNDGTGFDVLLHLGRHDFHVIFVTVHEEKAVTAFRFSATDYLIKPVNIEELKAAVEKVREDLKHKLEALSVQALLEIITSGNNNIERVNIPSLDGFKIIDLDEIITCEADGFCTIFHLKEGKRVVSSKNLKYYEEMMSLRGFMRVHNSFMVHLKHVREYSSDGLITLQHGYTAPLGNKYKRYFLNFFRNNK